MKKLILFLMLFLIVPTAFAEITITTDQNTYNLGNKLKASASILRDNNFEGLFKLTLSCKNYKLQYFLTPINLEANFRTAVAVPELAVTSSMLGNCIIIGDLVTNDNLIVEEKESNSFSITNKLTVLPLSSKVTSLPGEAIQVIGVVNEAFGNNVLKASTSITLDNYSYVVEAVDGKFNLTLEIHKNIKSGKHTIEISTSDSKDNSGSSSIELEITAVPSYLKTDLSGNQFSPGSKIEITSSLYDQADDLINDSLELELTSSTKNKVFRKVVNSNEKIDYEFSQYAEPGSYALVSSYKNLLAQSLINITTVREVKVKYENESVFIENIGNIPFADELTFILKSESKNYLITKAIDIEPGKMLGIDLSKEAQSGIYDVLLPIKEGLEPVTGKVSETIQDILEPTDGTSTNLVPEDESVLADDVTIHDNRPFYKKFASGLSSITSALVGADGILAKNPILAPLVLIVIVLLVVFRYGRKPIMRLIKGKKDDEEKKE